MNNKTPKLSHIWEALTSIAPVSAFSFVCLSDRFICFLFLVIYANQFIRLNVYQHDFGSHSILLHFSSIKIKINARAKEEKM